MKGGSHLDGKGFEQGHLSSRHTSLPALLALGQR